MEDFLVETKIEEPYGNNEYPTEEDLSAIEKWDFDRKDISGLIEYVEKLWHWSDWGFKKRWGYGRPVRRKVLKLELHTGGWSGNEDVIRALQENFVFWTLYWEKSVRGGHYYFEIPARHVKTKELKGEAKWNKKGLKCGRLLSFSVINGLPAL